MGFQFFRPAAPFFLFMQGKATTIPKDTEITAYVNGEIKLDRQRFMAKWPTAAEHPAICTGTAGDKQRGPLPESNCATNNSDHISALVQAVEWWK